MEARYAFGRNWQSYSERFLNDEAVTTARTYLSEAFGVTDFSGRSFVDLGCGSGLFSLAAHDLGAERVFSLDVDRDSVACCDSLRVSRGSPTNWEVRCGSLLDEAFMSGIGTFDLAFCWGVLHHTGDLWRALANCKRLLHDQSLFYLAVYNDVSEWSFDNDDGRFGTSAFWSRTKKTYLDSPDMVRRMMETVFGAAFALNTLCHGRSLGGLLAGIRGRRGMHWNTDLKDWLGGFPYQPASVEAMNAFFNRNGLVVRKEIARTDLRNNEFLVGSRRA